MGAAFTPRMATAGATKRWAPLIASLLVWIETGSA